MESFYVLKVLCTDGVHRVGMLMKGGGITPKRRHIIYTNCSEDYAEQCVKEYSEEHEIEIFDAESEKYEADVI